MSGSPDAMCDLLVVGSGAGGLSAAVTAARLGLDVLVIEKEAQFGGTTAWSGGWLWIPGNPLAQQAGIVEDVDAPRTYLRHELGDGYDEAMVSTFLEQGPRMLSFFQKETSVAFIGGMMPDFHDRTPGSGMGGRSVCAAPFDGRVLGERIKDLRPPLDDIAPFGMNIASGADLQHFFQATHSLRSAAYVVRRLLKHMIDLARFGRGMALLNGNALIARLLKSADDLGVRLKTATSANHLIVEKACVLGAVAVGSDGQPIRIRARRGVVLATGGFPHDLARMSALFPHAPTGHEHWSAAPRSNTGDGLKLGEAAGGTVRRDLFNAGAWAPVSLVPKRAGKPGHYPHLVDRAKPGVIMVCRNGRRFANEADSYHDVMRALFAATPAGDPVEAWLVCDAGFLRRYGLGRVRPFPFARRAWIKNGYLRRGRTIEELANDCGIDARAFARTLSDYNAGTTAGSDPQFKRGESPYNKAQGEPLRKPNPCVAPIVAAPFYAVKILPGSLGTFAGLKTDPDARVLDHTGAPVSGLYAVGNDMSSMMAGHYPAGGITLGPAMTFGYIAAHHAAGVPIQSNNPPDVLQRGHHAL